MTYGNAEGFKEYLGSRGKKFNCSWTDDVIDSALLVASEWIDGVYESLFVGYKTGGYNQERSWPRTSATIKTGYSWHTFADNEIPENVVKATYEAALRHLKNENALQSDYTPSKYRSVSVQGAVSVVFDERITGASDVQTEFPIIQTLLNDLIDTEGGKDLSPLSGKVTRV